MNSRRDFLSGTAVGAVAAVVPTTVESSETKEEGIDLTKLTPEQLVDTITQIQAEQRQRDVEEHNELIKKIGDARLKRWAKLREKAYDEQEHLVKVTITEPIEICVLISSSHGSVNVYKPHVTYDIADCEEIEKALLQCPVVKKTYDDIEKSTVLLDKEIKALSKKIGVCRMDIYAIVTREALR